MKTLLRMLIADRKATRLGIRMALDGQVLVCAESSDAEQAIRAAKREAPDLCLIGRQLGGHGLGTVRSICRAAPHTAVIVLAREPDVEDLLSAVRAGAVGYMPGPLDAPGLRRLVQAVAEHEAVVPRAMVLELVLELRGTGSGGDGLSARELQVLGMLRRGHSTADIASRLDITRVTVRRHISDLVHKLGVENRSVLITATPNRSGRQSHDVTFVQRD